MMVSRSVSDTRYFALLPTKTLGAPNEESVTATHCHRAVLQQPKFRTDLLKSCVDYVGECYSLTAAMAAGRGLVWHTHTKYVERVATIGTHVVVHMPAHTHTSEV